MGQRSDLGVDWNDIITGWFCSSLQIAPEVAWDALGTVERIYPQAIDEALKSGPSTFSMVKLVDLGSVLALTEQLTGFASVLSRLQNGERAALSELTVAASFVRLGYQPTLEPEVMGRRPDFSIALDQDVVMFEVVTPEFSDVFRELEQRLTKTANRVKEAFPGACINIVFVADPDIKRRLLY
jgi:hypothetical protein